MKRGRLTPEEKTEIERLATTLQKPTPGAIAQRLDRHPCTINWHMICHGLIERKVTYRSSRPDARGHTPYTRDHDKRMLELRRQNIDIKRNRHSVHNRLMMLAAYQEDDE
jgi:IS30 family transposase